MAYPDLICMQQVRRRSRARISGLTMMISGMWFRVSRLSSFLTNIQTTQTRRSNMGHEGIPDLLVQCSSHCFQLVCGILSPSFGIEHVGVHCHCAGRPNPYCDRYRVQWSRWSKIPYRFPCTEQSRLWSVRSMVAHVQPCCDGHCMERSQRRKWYGHATHRSSLTSYRFKEDNAST
jgi:hypothetical protein